MRRYAWGDKQVNPDLNKIYQDFMMDYIKSNWSFIMFDNYEFSVWLVHAFLGHANNTYIPFEYKNMKIHIVCYQKFEHHSNGFAAIRDAVMYNKIKV